MKRIIDREYPDAYKETLLVLDGTTGQNAVNQAREFKEATDVSGVVITKLDGSSKGGMAIAVTSELSIPVKYIGVGEGIEDLQRFDIDDYVKALFYREGYTEDADETQ
jgi:fused signal recognition particle receptor